MEESPETGAARENGSSSIVQQVHVQQVRTSLSDDSGKSFCVRRSPRLDAHPPEGFLQPLVQAALPKPPPRGS